MDATSARRAAARVSSNTPNGRPVKRSNKCSDAELLKRAFVPGRLETAGNAIHQSEGLGAQVSHSEINRDEIGQRLKDLALIQALIANGIEKALRFSTLSDVGPTRVSVWLFLSVLRHDGLLIYFCIDLMSCHSSAIYNNPYMLIRSVWSTSG